MTGSQGTMVTALADALKWPAFAAQFAAATNTVSAEMLSSEIVDSLVMDASGRLCFGWVDGRDYLPHLATSTDGGVTWSKSVLLSPPGVATTAMLSLAMTKTGRLGFSYYGTLDHTTITGYLSVTDNPAAATPKIQTSTISRPGHPIMNEPCCWGGSTQEYTSARWAPDGSLWASFASPISVIPGIGPPVRRLRADSVDAERSSVSRRVHGTKDPVVPGTLIPHPHGGPTILEIALPERKSFEQDQPPAGASREQ